MKVIIAGGREFKDYNKIEKAVKQSGFEITEVVSGRAQGADQLGEKWARSHKIRVKPFPAKWNDLDQPGAVVKVNKWGKKYNANAGFFRNEEMAKYADALIAVEGGGGTRDMIKRAKKHNLKVHVYEKDDSEYEYKF